MMVWLRHVLGWLGSAFCAREDLIPRKSCVASAVARSSSPAPSPATHCVTQAVLVVLRKLWDKWKEPLILATPRTVVDWHRAGFRLYWKWLSRARQRGGRRPVSQEVRALIFRMAAEHPTWGAPRIHGELLML